MKLSPKATAFTASSPASAAGATAARPAPRGSLGGGLRPPSEASPQESLRRQSRRSNLDDVARSSLRQPPSPLLCLEPPLVRRHDAQLLAVASEGGFAPLPKPPPRNRCAGKAGARTSMTSHEALSESHRLYRFFACKRRWCDGSTPSSSR